MGEVMQPHTIKYAERHTLMLAAIQVQAEPFRPSASHVFRVALERLYEDFCIAGSVKRDAGPAQEFQDVTKESKVTPQRQGKRRVG